jgi:hypothetical protein
MNLRGMAMGAGVAGMCARFMAGIVSNGVTIQTEELVYMPLLTASI